MMCSTDEQQRQESGWNGASVLQAEHGRQSLAGFRKRNVLRQKMPTQCLYEQEAQGGHILRDRGWSQLLRLEQMGLILPDLLGPELVRRLVKIIRELADGFVQIAISPTIRP